MIRKQLLGSVLMVLVLASQAFAAAGDPLFCKLNWKPGETYRYKIELESNASSQGQTVQMRLSTSVALKVLTTQGEAAATHSPEGDAPMAAPSPSFGLEGRTTDIEMRYGDLKMTLGMAGNTVAISVAQNSVKATLNGSPLPASKVDELRKEIKPRLELLKTPIRIQMTDSGRIVSVSGLEKLDAATQQELALNFLEGMLLPGKPLKVGENYVEKRSFARVAPKNAGGAASGLSGRTVELVRTGLKNLH